MSFEKLDWLDITAKQEIFIAENFKPLMKTIQDGWVIRCFFGDEFYMMDEPIQSEINFTVRTKKGKRQLLTMMILRLPDGRFTQPQPVPEQKQLLQDVIHHHPHKNIYQRNQIQRLKNELDKLPTKEESPKKSRKI